MIQKSGTKATQASANSGGNKKGAASRIADTTQSEIFFDIRWRDEFAMGFLRQRSLCRRTAGKKPRRECSAPGRDLHNSGRRPEGSKKSLLPPTQIPYFSSLNNPARPTT